MLRYTTVMSRSHHRILRYRRHRRVPEVIRSVCWRRKEVRDWMMTVKGEIWTRQSSGHGRTGNRRNQRGR